MAKATDANETSVYSTNSADKSKSATKYDFTKLNTLAVVAFAAALTSIGAVAAIITGHISLAQIKKSGENGRPLALAGLVIGYLTIFLWIIGSIGWLLFKLSYLGGGYGYNSELFFNGGQMGPGMMFDRD